jgi:hypothetical protein
MLSIKQLFLVAAIVVLRCCAGANISNQMLEYEESVSSKMIRCIDPSDRQGLHEEFSGKRFYGNGGGGGALLQSKTINKFIMMMM